MKLGWREFRKISWFNGRGRICLFLLIRRRDFGSEFIFDELSKCLIVGVCLKMVPTSLEDSCYEVKCQLTESFEERDIFLPVILQLSIADEIGNSSERNLNVVNINLL